MQHSSWNRWMAAQTYEHVCLLTMGTVSECPQRHQTDTPNIHIKGHFLWMQMCQLLKRKVHTSKNTPILLIIQRKVGYIECIDVEQAIYHRKVCSDMRCTYYSKTILLSPCSLAEMSISSSSPVLPLSCGKYVLVGTSLWPIELVKGRGGLAEGLQMGQEIPGEGVGNEADRVCVGGQVALR